MPLDRPHILVIGGAGYIGSQLLKGLAQAGYRLTTLDNLSTGYAHAVRWGDLVRGDLGDERLLTQLFERQHFDAVVHLAARIEAGLSLTDPLAFYDNNLGQTLRLLRAMQSHQIRKLVFSSTAATFGEPLYTPIDELHPQQAINPYGRSKLMVEQVLSDCDRAYGLQSVSLRYFNAAGADPDGELGESHQPETHLIPLVLQTAQGRRPAITVHGTDYDTPDGTCIRDFIHVSDLCQAHVLALEHLLRGGSSQHYNLGNGRGHSVREVIDTARAVTGHPIRTVEAPRRPGDPARLIADARRARKELGWQPLWQELSQIIAHAWQWEQTRSLRKSALG